MLKRGGRAPKVNAAARDTLAMFTAAALRGQPANLAEPGSMIHSTTAPSAPGALSEGARPWD